MVTLIRPLLLALVLPVLAGLSGLSRADTVLVVNARSGITQLSTSEAINIYMGRYRRLPNGGVALPIDQPQGHPLRADFYRALVNKSEDEINAYWARLVFSGKTSPPLQAERSEEITKLLARHPGGLAYVERSQVDPRLMHIVLEFRP